MQVRAAPLRPWLRLAHTPRLGPRAARALLDRFASPDAIFDPASRVALGDFAGPDLADLLGREPDAATRAACERAVRWLEDGPRRSLLTLADPDYPAPLRELADAPPLLYCHGRRELLGLAAVGLVGSRNATRPGVLHARELARDLARAGLAVVSGLARGIDTAAHAGALDAPGATIAVLGTGIDRVYPAANAALARRIGEEGLLLSEFALGAPPIDLHFPRRNRIIAGIARGVVVVEAAQRSGSLITARLAAEAGRDVFAVPGPVRSPMSRGCHQLLRDGAMLVECAGDVLAGLLPGSAPPSPEPRACGPESELLRALGPEPVAFDDILQRTGAPAGDLAAGLLELELERRIERLPGNRYLRVG